MPGTRERGLARGAVETAAPVGYPAGASLRHRGPSLIRSEARDWFDGALVDLEEARDALSRGRYNWALFAAHQAVEKDLKAAYMMLKRARPLGPTTWSAWSESSVLSCPGSCS